jgi:undecaprenyl-diphosphatase
MQQALIVSSAPGPVGPDHNGVAVLPPKGLNTSVYLDLNHFARQTEWAHSFMHTYALWLGPVLLALVFVAAYGLAWWNRAPRASALLVLGGVGTLAALGVNLLVAHAARELRPYYTHPHVLVLVAKANDYSFPSDHSVVAGGLTFSLVLVLAASAWPQRQGQSAGADGRVGGSVGRATLVRAFLAVNVALGLFLCFARVYVGAHYPGDVVAGYLLASVLVLAFSLLRPLVYSLVDILEPTLLGALLRRPVLLTGARASAAGPLGPPKGAAGAGR